MSLRDRFDKWPSMYDPYSNSDTVQRDTLTKIGRVLVELAAQAERIADALQKQEETTSITKVKVVEHARYRDGGTIEYRDIQNRVYVVPAPIYQRAGIYNDTRQTTWVESERLKGIELDIVESFT